jgi:hypothetical protein
LRLKPQLIVTLKAFPIDIQKTGNTEKDKHSSLFAVSAVTKKNDVLQQITKNHRGTIFPSSFFFFFLIEVCHFFYFKHKKNITIKNDLLFGLKIFWLDLSIVTCYLLIATFWYFHMTWKRGNSGAVTFRRMTLSRTKCVYYTNQETYVSTLP